MSHFQRLQTLFWWIGLVAVLAAAALSSRALSYVTISSAAAATATRVVDSVNVRLTAVGALSPLAVIVELLFVVGPVDISEGAANSLLNTISGAAKAVHLLLLSGLLLLHSYCYLCYPRNC